MYLIDINNNVFKDLRLLEVVNERSDSKCDYMLWKIIY